jgi:predicted RNase H-like HicB family nuclease
MMKTLNDYMKLNYRMEIVEDEDEGGFVVSYPDLPGCITCGETIETAIENAADAKRAWIEAALEEGIEIQVPERLEDYSGQFKLRILPDLSFSDTKCSVEGTCLFPVLKTKVLCRELDCIVWLIGFHIDL